MLGIEEKKKRIQAKRTRGEALSGEHESRTERKYISSKTLKRKDAKTQSKIKNCSLGSKTIRSFFAFLCPLEPAR